MRKRQLVASPEVADYLNIADVTLRKWRARDYGPPSYTIGTAVRYDMAEVKAWLKQQRTAAAAPKPQADLNQVIEILDLLFEIPTLDEDETPQDVLRRIEGCDHSMWDSTGHNGDDFYRCGHCGVTPSLAAELGLNTEFSHCGHELIDREDYELLARHVDAALVGEGAFWTCEMETLDWNTDAEDDSAHAA
jgi:predicted DNA-binding transcriptional regulator AlpA